MTSLKKPLSALLCAVLLLSLLAGCTPAAAWPLEIQTSVDAASLENAPEGTEGTITCDLTYDPGKTLCMTLHNDTNQPISTYVAGELYGQNETGLWYKVGDPDVWMPLTANIYDPGGSSSPFYAIGLEGEPTLESGEYQFVLGTSCGKASFDLTVPFTVP